MEFKGDYMEVLYEVRGENLFIYLPEELDHHNSKVITEQSDWYIVSNFQLVMKAVYLTPHILL